jgi:penicillin amidase
MAKTLGRIIFYLIIILGLLIILTAIIAPPYIQNQAEESFPTVDGELLAPDLIAPVEIYRDKFGIPHIYGTNHHDLFFAQGFVHAQDRFWQMDFWRHLGAGRLAEFVGPPMLETDKFLRTLGWERISKQELELLGEEETVILESYSEGVNYYLSQNTGIELSLEYLFLPITNRGYEPPPWKPLNSLTWAKAMAWDLRGNLDAEITRAKLLLDLSPDQLAELYPDYPAGHPYIVPGTDNQDEQGNLDTTPYNGLHLISALEEVLIKLEYSSAAIDELSGGGFESIGSNSWAISGQMTDSGKPYLANDTHLGAQMPSIWYEIGLHCLERSETCQLDVTGYSFAGVPGVVFGHNDRIAWGVTNLGPDVMDLYIEKLHRDDPNLYLTPDGWEEFEVITEIINVAGRDPVEHQVLITRHGPLIGSDYGLEDFDEIAGIEVPEYYGLSLQWTALEPSCVFCAVWDFNLAKNWEEFQEAAKQFSVPAQNLLYADVDGNIAYQMPGKIPIRDKSHDGTLPVPGWKLEYDWQGYIPFDELPHSLNPPEGYIVTANNAVVNIDYPYLITKDWSYGFRAQRIKDLINTAPDPINLAYIKRMQGDNYEPLAEYLVPLLLDLQISDPELIAALQLLGNWDYQADIDSGAAALFMLTWQNLLDQVFQDDVPEDYQVGVESRAKEIIRLLIDAPYSSWWDDRDTQEIENRNDILQAAFEESYKQLTKDQGKDPASWNWGNLHTITFQNQVMNSFPFIRKVFNRGPFAAAGGNEIINATGWDPSDPFVIDWLPSQRMIVDLNDISNSISIHTTGQSGHAYHPHYIDMADLWRKIYYHPMLWTRQQVKANSESLLILAP